MNFKPPEFSTTRDISWAIHADEKTNPQKASCDLIMGTDLMKELGIDIHFSDKRVEWDGVEVPMRSRRSTHDHIEQLCEAATATPLLAEAEKRHKIIIDADHSPFDVDEFCASLKHITAGQRQDLSFVLK